MEEAVTDQIVKTTKIQIDQSALMTGYEIPTQNGSHEYPAHGDSQRQLGIDGDIVDIQTNQMQYGVNYGRQSNEEGTIISKNSGFIKEQIPPDIQELPQVIEAMQSFKDASPFTLVGWSMKESLYKQNISKYLERLDVEQRESFAPIDKLIESSLNGYDLHILVMKHLTDLSKNDASSIQGLVIFNQESNTSKVNGKPSSKIILHHISTVKKENRDFIFDQALDFIWKYSHCDAIRMNLYHIKNPESGQMKADPEIKAILKVKKFKWKTVINDQNTGMRSEILEVANTEHQKQLIQS